MWTMKEKDQLATEGLVMFWGLGSDLPGTQVTPLFISFIIWSFHLRQLVGVLS